MTAERVTVVDSVFAPTGQGYRRTRVHHAGGYTVRIDVVNDTYEFQSYARVEVITPALTWTHLASSPTSDWRRGLPYRTDDARVLEPIPDRLLDRALRILPPTSGDPRRCDGPTP